MMAEHGQSVSDKYGCFDRGVQAHVTGSMGVSFVKLTAALQAVM